MPRYTPDSYSPHNAERCETAYIPEHLPRFNGCLACHRCGPTKDRSTASLLGKFGVFSGDIGFVHIAGVKQEPILEGDRFA